MWGSTSTSFFLFADKGTQSLDFRWVATFMQPFDTFSLFESNSIVIQRPQRSKSQQCSDSQWLGTGNMCSCMQEGKCLRNSPQSLPRGNGHQRKHHPHWLGNVQRACTTPSPMPAAAAQAGCRGGLECGQHDVGAGRRPELAVKELSPGKPAFLSITAPRKACLTVKDLHMYKCLCYSSNS